MINLVIDFWIILSVRNILVFAHFVAQVSSHSLLATGTLFSEVPVHGIPGAPNRIRLLCPEGARGKDGV